MGEHRTLLWCTVIVACMFAQTNGQPGTRCDSIDLCSCAMTDGSVVDLTSLGNKDNTPRYASRLIKHVNVAFHLNDAF